MKLCVMSSNNNRVSDALIQCLKQCTARKLARRLTDANALLALLHAWRQAPSKTAELPLWFFTLVPLVKKIMQKCINGLK